MTHSPPAFHSRINTGSEEFAKNRADMQVLVDRLHEVLARAADLSDKALPRFRKRGQLLPRERLGRVLDPGSPFLEINNMAGFLVSRTLLLC